MVFYFWRGGGNTARCDMKLSTQGFSRNNAFQGFCPNTGIAFTRTSLCSVAWIILMPSDFYEISTLW